MKFFRVLVITRLESLGMLLLHFHMRVDSKILSSINALKI